MSSVHPCAANLVWRDLSTAFSLLIWCHWKNSLFQTGRCAHLTLFGKGLWWKGRSGRNPDAYARACNTQECWPWRQHPIQYHSCHRFILDGKVSPVFPCTAVSRCSVEEILPPFSFLILKAQSEVISQALSFHIASGPPVRTNLYY